MSAWVVSKLDIDILVTATRDAGGVEAGREYAFNGTELGKMLWTENVNSVAYRYDMPKRHASEHADYLAAVEAYEFEPFAAKPVAIAKIARCYDYQSCEHPAWDASPSKRIVDGLMERYSDKLPGYDRMPWGADANGIGEDKLATIRA